ncbi:hypothetical protein CRM22_003024 [Opisthorchis felineus]|uniref:WW domain-containing protein n=1 Tax=Opisthorchis felineus TaxID=147828 RepID=A0A4S2M9E5_OPIFE|nr:hypothetical protein CRM22_003024 [Opisthorchis felineus]
MLPSEYYANTRVETFTEVNLANLDILIDSRVAIVCATPYTTTSAPSQPMMIYSRSSRNSDIHCTTDGGQWTRLDQVAQHLRPRLPPGTLVWGQPTYEYVTKNGRRKYALMIFDVACIYGQDCRHLPFTERMQLARRMADVVNFPGMDASYVRVAPLVRLRNLPSYVKGLPYLPCKDAPNHVPMNVHPDGIAFQPHSLLLVRHLAEPWSEAVSRTSGHTYYFNRTTCESTFELPPNQQYPFSQTQFARVPWVAGRPHEVSVQRLVQSIEHFCQTVDRKG